jgi:hypothetical protein
MGFYALGTVEAYPTGGSGPTAFGPTSFFGSDPQPARLGDSINTPADLGDFTSIFRNINISNTHGGKTRIQSTFFKFKLTRPRAIQITQNYSPTSYQANTNRNTIISAYRIEDGTHRRELSINNNGYVCGQASITDDGDSSYGDGIYQSDYLTGVLDSGDYILLITNDIRYLETTYSFSISVLLNDWRYVAESISESIDFGSDVGGYDTSLDFGSVVQVAGTKATYPYSSTSGLGYTQAGVSP